MRLVLFLLLLCSNQTVASSFEHFITRDGSQLKDGDKTFRFVGLNAPELHRIEDDIKGVCANDRRGWGQHFKWPTSDEQENWVKSLVRTGHKATRIYVLSVEHEDDAKCGRETHILKPDLPNGMPLLNEKAMVVFDQLIAHADKYGLRLIVPFIDHWEWWGGRKQLAAFYDETEDDFYRTNSKTYAAYLHIIEQVISRKNTITGRYYYQEKSVMAWETGNELKLSTPAFVAETAKHIKSLAPNQLVVDGNYLSILPSSLTDPNVDIISNHFYTVNGNNNPETVKENLAAIDGNKVYLVGEFGLKPIEGLTEIMDTVRSFEHQGHQAAGAMIWGFRGRRHNGGFYWHPESGGAYYSYHLPGFKEGDFNQERHVTKLLRDVQAKMDGYSSTPKLPVPEAPILRNVTPDLKLAWLGAPVGESYIIERKVGKAQWQVIASNVSDGKNRFNPDVDVLYQDTQMLNKSGQVSYRIIAVNESGKSLPSNVVSTTIGQPNAFIQVKNGQFVKRGKPYYFVGTNYWYGPLLGAPNGDRQRLIKELDNLQAHGINNLRILVGGDGGNTDSSIKPALQIKPGIYNQDLLLGLDFLLAEMAKRNMEAVLYLNNNWIWSGGMSQYLAWHGFGDIPNPFSAQYDWPDYMSYTEQFHRCLACKNSYYRHVKFIIERENSITGVPYNQDPTIMSWQLANEPRVFSLDNFNMFKLWVDESVNLIHSLAPNQLISTGSEGIAGSTNNLRIYQVNHHNTNIDYLTMHMWPKNWSWYNKDDEAASLRIAIDKANQYMGEHIAVAKEMNRPIVMSEFGFPRNNESLSPNASTDYRDKFYQAMFENITQSYQQQGVLAGFNFWAYGGYGQANPDNNYQWQQGDDFLGDPAQEPQGLNTVFASDASTLSIIKQVNQVLNPIIK
ncbi:hypothetical protein [Thalassotalea sp. G2M2-11]|uniref:hypothetical protein n=1 Tax=Thalassotalea sp. G2M2-11 TaxID=2787627 RepID=UPI0019D15209|nr:hypothetical protein [Thalassotalea sp. G2M2-11]